MEYRLYFTVFVLFCLLIVVLIGLNDSTMTLVLTQQHEMWFLYSIERFTSLLRYNNLSSRLILIQIDLNYSKISIEHKDKLFTLEISKINIHNICKSSIKTQTLSIIAFNNLNFFAILVKFIMSQSFHELSRKEFPILRKLLKMNNGRYFRERIILIINLIEHIHSLLVVNH